MGGTEIKDIRNTESVLGSEWTPIYSTEVEFASTHFKTAMMNIIRQPNVNSTVIMRADIVREEKLSSAADSSSGDTLELISEDRSDIDHSSMPLHYNLEDVEPRRIGLELDYEIKLTDSIVRRIIPRNPKRDPVINQTCLVYNTIDKDPKTATSVVIYLPHISITDQCPYYLPPAKAVALVYEGQHLSVHYVPFNNIVTQDDGERSIRIALRLLQTAQKHSQGVMDGYQKRVNHDVIVDKAMFQDRYIALKQKYAQTLTTNWVESTDPKKHVFEDLAIAAFLIELWGQMYTKGPSEFSFLDLGCGNGLLVHILLQEGYQGYGIDARARKSWDTYPPECKETLKEQVAVPQVLLDPNSDDKTHQELLADPGVNTLNLSPKTFVIGNHSDELTLWVPLLGCPFMVIPCCSHSLSGAKFRFPAKCPENKSTYASLVDHVEDIATLTGWKVEKERLRIPSTRNAALIGRYRHNPEMSVSEIIAQEGGADGWVQRSFALRSKSPRGH